MTDLAQAPELEAPIPPTDDKPEGASETTEIAPQKTEVELLKEAHTKALQREQRRIDTITRRRYEAEGLTKAAQERIAELEAKLTQSTSAATKPQLADFKTIEDFTEAMADWKAGARVEKQLQEFRQNELKGHEQQVREQQHARAHEAFGQALATVEEAGKKQFTDFVDVVTKGPQLGPLIGTLVMQTEQPAAITYYLAKNPDVGLSIASMDRTQAAMAIARLESQLASRRTTNAPPPPPELGARNAANKWTPDDVSGNAADWIARRNKELKAKK